MPKPSEIDTHTFLDLALELAELQRRLAKGLLLMLDEEETSPDQWRVLSAIATLSDPTMSELATETCLPNATLTRTVDSLVDNALVFRLASKQDRRRINVYLSEFGRQRLNRLELMAAGWGRTLSHEIGDELCEDLQRTVTNALAALKAKASPASRPHEA